MLQKYLIILFFLISMLISAIGNAGVPVFVVTGVVFDQTGKQVEGEYHIEVRNMTTGILLRAVTGAEIDNGRYTVTFFSLEGGEIATEGDVIMVSVKGRGRNLIGTTLYTLTEQDVKNASVNIDVTMGRAINASLPAQDGTPVFVVCGVVHSGEGKLLDSDFTIQVENQTKNLGQEVLSDVDASPVSYMATFYDLEGGCVASVGDTIKVTLKSPFGKAVLSETYSLTDANIASGLAVIDFRLPPAPRVTRISPSRGGDTGIATVSISGYNLDPDYEIKLTREGEMDIDAMSVSGLPGGHLLIARFNLIGKARGQWNLAIVIAGGLTVVLEDAFVIEAGRSPELWVDVMGPDFLRPGRTTRFIIIVNNRSNVDAMCPTLWIDGIPSGAEWELEGEMVDLSEYIQKVDLNRDDDFDWSELPLSIDLDGHQLIPLIIPLIPPYGSFSLPLKIKPNWSEGSFTLKVSISHPMLEPQPNEIAYEHASLAPSMFGSQEYGGGISPEAQKCIEKALWTLFDLLVSGGIKGGVEKFLPVPYKRCIGEAFRTIYYVFRSLSDMEGHRPDPVRDQAVNLAGSYYVVWCYFMRTVIACFLDAVGLSYAFDALEITAYAVKALKVYYFCMGMSYQDIRDLVLLFPIDPNLKDCPDGYGDEHYCKPGEKMPYFIYFENLENAPVPAQEVLITDHLDENLDWSTFSFGAMQIGEKTIDIATGIRNFATTVDLRPGMPALLDVSCRFDSSTGQVQWLFKGKDPYTWELADILPPNDADVAPKGEGWVLYTVKAKPDLPTGTVIRNMSTIDFEVNVPPEPIDTPEVFNTIDASIPTSRCMPLPQTPHSGTFWVEWEGTDEGSGIMDYTIYVSDEGASFTRWLSYTTETRAEFSGDYGHTYYFYSCARDNVGNIEEPPDTADAFTRPGIPPWDVNQDGAVDIVDLILVGSSIGKQPPDKDLDVNSDGGIDIMDLATVAKHFGETYDYNPIEADLRP